MFLGAPEHVEELEAGGLETTGDGLEDARVEGRGEVLVLVERVTQRAGFAHEHLGRLDRDRGGCGAIGRDDRRPAEDVACLHRQHGGGTAARDLESQGDATAADDAEVGGFAALPEEDVAGFRPPHLAEPREPSPLGVAQAGGERRLPQDLHGSDRLHGPSLGGAVDRERGPLVGHLGAVGPGSAGPRRRNRGAVRSDRHGATASNGRCALVRQGPRLFATPASMGDDR